MATGVIANITVGGTTTVAYLTGAAGAPTQFYAEVLVAAGWAYTGTNVCPPGVRIPLSTTLTTVVMRADTAPVGAALIVALQRTTALGATTQIGTVTIADGASIGTTSLSVALAVGDVIRFDITQIGTTTPGSDVAVQLICP